MLVSTSTSTPALNPALIPGKYLLLMRIHPLLLGLTLLLPLGSVTRPAIPTTPPGELVVRVASFLALQVTYLQWFLLTVSLVTNMILRLEH